MAELLLKDESYAIVGACFEVYNQMGPGFLEAVYQECLSIEFQARTIPFVSQPQVPIHFTCRRLTQTYRADFVCYEKIIIEIKAKKSLDEIDQAQLLNYLKATRLPLGILVNFCSPNQLEYQRIANTRQSPRFA